MWSNRIASGAVMVEGLWKGMSRLSNFSLIYVLIQGGCWDISTPALRILDQIILRISTQLVGIWDRMLYSSEKKVPSSVNIIIGIEFLEYVFLTLKLGRLIDIKKNMFWIALSRNVKNEALV